MCLLSSVVELPFHTRMVTSSNLVVGKIQIRQVIFFSYSNFWNKIGKFIEKMQDFFLSCKECRIDSPRNFYGMFYIGPFTGSQSLTVANALRRTLLSELTGISITSVQIDSVNHEFSTLIGVRESVFDILLNLKEIVLKSSSALKKTQIGYLQAYGPGVIRACDLNLPSNIQCVDPDQYIATLSQDGKLIMKFTINEGKNSNIQKPSVLKKSDSFNQTNFKNAFSEKNMTMLIDATFMPVNKVNYVIESYEHYQEIGLSNSNKMSNTQNIDLSKNIESQYEFLQPSLAQQALRKQKLQGQGESTGLPDQVIILEIWTNGSLHPRQALYKALNNLMNLFLQLEKMRILNAIFSKAIGKSNETYNKMRKKVEYEYDYYTQIERAQQMAKTLDNLSPEAILAYEKKYKKELLMKKNKRNIQVANLNISNRSRRLLENAKIYNLTDLLEQSTIRLRKIKGFGEKSLKEVIIALKEIGLSLKSN